MGLNVADHNEEDNAPDCKSCTVISNEKDALLEAASFCFPSQFKTLDLDSLDLPLSGFRRVSSGVTSL